MAIVTSSPVPAQAPAHIVRALALFVVGLLLFACMDTTTKYLSARYDVPMIVAARFLGNLVLMLALTMPSQGLALVRTQRTSLVWLRGACLAGGSLFIGLALQRMPVAETTAIAFSAPVLIMLAAGPLLGERIGARGWTSALLGFIGVLLIARPGSGLDATGVLCAIMAVGLGAGYQLLSRVLATTERTLTLLFYSALVGSIVFTATLPFFLSDHSPSAFDWLLLASLGAYGGLGHYLFTAAFRHAPASLLAPVNYLQLLWAALLGWLVFGHVPDPIGLIGIGIIALSGVLVALRRKAAG